MKYTEFLAQLDQKAISDAIGRAESACSGEVRVHVEPRLRGGEIRHVAERTFERLGMTKTAQRNGVLLFVAAEEQKFAILGDKGVNDLCEPTFWDDIARSLTERFRAGQFTAGIVEAIDRAGTKLVCHFPPRAGDTNELTNDISTSDDSSHH